MPKKERNSGGGSRGADLGSAMCKAICNFLRYCETAELTEDDVMAIWRAAEIVGKAPALSESIVKGVALNVGRRYREGKPIPGNVVVQFIDAHLPGGIMAAVVCSDMGKAQKTAQQHGDGCTCSSCSMFRGRGGKI